MIGVMPSWKKPLGLNGPPTWVTAPTEEVAVGSSQSTKAKVPKGRDAASATGQLAITMSDPGVTTSAEKTRGDNVSGKSSDLRIYVYCPFGAT